MISNHLFHHTNQRLKASHQFADNLIPLFLIAVNFGRADIRIFYYTNMKEINERKINKKNILKKEFENSTNYVLVKSSLINMEEIIK